MSELNYGQFNISQQLAVFVNSLYAKNKCLCFVHKGLCSNPCIQDECLQGLAVGAIHRHLNSWVASAMGLVDSQRRQETTKLFEPIAEATLS